MNSHLNPCHLDSCWDELLLLAARRRPCLLVAIGICDGDVTVNVKRRSIMVAISLGVMSTSGKFWKQTLCTLLVQGTCSIPVNWWCTPMNLFVPLSLVLVFACAHEFLCQPPGFLCPGCHIGVCDGDMTVNYNRRAIIIAISLGVMNTSG